MRLLATEESLKALLALRLNQDFNVVIGEIAAYVEERNKQLVFTTKPEQLPSLQGQVRAWVELMEAIQSAPERFERLQRGET